MPSQGEGNGNLLQYSCLEIPMDRGAWKAAVHGVAEGWTQQSDFAFTFMHWRRKWQPTPVFLPGESQGWGSLVGCHLWGHTESDTTEVIAVYAFSCDTVEKNPPATAGDVSSIPGLGKFPGVGNGNPLQYSCLENSRDRGTWRATVSHGFSENWKLQSERYIFPGGASG